ncbi:MAG: hypothetical protein ACLPYY_18215 [Acidimicrobiales bacterium]
MTSKDIGEAALGDRDTEFLQLADDAQVAPAGVLTSQTDDQLDRVGAENLIRPCEQDE